MIVFAIGPENFAAFAANENKEVITMPNLAAAALAAAGAFAPYNAAEAARSIFAWLAGIARLRAEFVMVEMLVTVKAFVKTTLFTPEIVHTFHLISRLVI